MNERIRFQLSVSVFVMLVREDAICMLRRKGTGWMDGSFSIPAGVLETGETIAAAAIREAYEEVGVIIAPENLHYVHTLHSKTDDRTWVGHFFRAEVWKGEPMLREPDKHSELQWRPIIALPSQTIPYVQQAIKCVADLKSYSEYGWGS